MKEKVATAPIIEVKPATEPLNTSQPIHSEVGTEAEAKEYIYFKESTHNIAAVNKSSGACGIGQSLPCSKLSNVCPNWKTDYECQDKWFTNYMERRYNSWINAMAFHKVNGWW